MTEPLVIDAGDLGVDELLSTLEDGKRVVVRTEFMGSNHEVTLRHDGDVYYCDTPTRLHKHESEEEMRACVAKQGYASE